MTYKPQHQTKYGLVLERGYFYFTSNSVKMKIFRKLLSNIIPNNQADFRECFLCPPSHTFTNLSKVLLKILINFNLLLLVTCISLM